ncbi:MAG: hypothetical protein A2X05_02400 [Bacteroidetes bacterium GWE2_41_25]|nr:MAG: hypothetical protein A2X03_10340 [Bacteroidetes bacterium GWA2_40_15]OFX95788.1 MAG: hypothetical protein A2X06_09390 [Bacteroidetes bacterium GWC2_40_22]OFY12578.1 MAG: hypothetical protein A2X05_02400 [Bacteroidetes bacterium GWE2_41_25]OFY57500.1 MAG: hypothetical protein A2X04_07230 [Bacteroidetes bacterium GWF2_41_9]HBH83175.1 hypothetical protein [Bacteroidales bacterium]
MRNVYLNKFAIEITGYSQEESNKLGSEYFRKVPHPDDFEFINQSVDENCILFVYPTCKEV